MDDNDDEDDIFDAFMNKQKEKKTNETSLPTTEEMKNLSIKEPRPVKKAEGLTYILPNNNNNTDNQEKKVTIMSKFWIYFIKYSFF